MTNEHHNDGGAGPGYETRDANFKNLMLTGIGLLGLMLFGLLFSWLVFEVSADHTADPEAPALTFAVPDSSKFPPGPNLQANPHEALKELRRNEDSLLSSYGWVNKDSAIVRVPVQRAKEIVLRRGLPYQTAAGSTKEGGK